MTNTMIAYDIGCESIPEERLMSTQKVLSQILPADRALSISSSSFSGADKKESVQNETGFNGRSRLGEVTL